MFRTNIASWRIFAAYGTSLTRRPITTQIVTGSVLVMAGDAAAQHLVEGRKWRDHDWQRMGNMLFLRGVLHSTMIIYWFRFLHTRVPLPNLSKNQRLAVHMTMDQGFFGPFNVAFFFIASGLLEGKSQAQIKEKLDDRLATTIASAWLLWVPFSFVAFRYIPLNHRLVAGQSVALGWNCFMSYQNYHAPKSMNEVQSSRSR